MKKIKEFVINKCSKSLIYYLSIYFKYYKKYGLLKLILFFIKNIFNIYIPSKKLSKGEQIKKLLNKTKIKIDNKRFIYNIDFFKTVNRSNRIIDNISIDYSIILNNSINDFKREIKNIKNKEYKNSQKELLLGIEEYIFRVCKKIQKSNIEQKDKLIKYLKNIIDKKSSSFEESIQRILFYNQLLWQVGHNLNGLGRLDKILEESYYNDLKSGKITQDEAKEMLKEMLSILHDNYLYKSNVLLGDTGQIIILGGKEENGKYFCNELTYMFIEVIQELKIPDPKVLLRVSKNIPRDLMEVSLNCIKTGVGSPLLSNDDVIIDKLIEFGYSKKDSYNYVTSACWEPLIASKSMDQNNIDSIVFAEPFIYMLEAENLEKITSFEKMITIYKKYLKEYLINFTNEINKIEWEECPLLSLLTEDCIKKELDVAKGGAKYNNYGITSVSLSTVINSLYNIKKYVFEEKKYSLIELNEYRKSNFVNKENILEMLKKQPLRYGVDDKNIIDLTNDITKFADNILSKQKTKLNGKFKFGFSAPTYIIKSTDKKATFDGRKDGDPFGVHISSDKSSLAYTELIQFASKLDYNNSRFNGNVIDFMITPSFIENNFNKMVDFLILSISLGFFQMQMNVISSKILIKAKENPKDYQGLIVRVWGFSAYFNDLPMEYKDLLIERALKNEGKS